MKELPLPHFSLPCIAAIAWQEIMGVPKTQVKSTDIQKISCSRGINWKYSCLAHDSKPVSSKGMKYTSFRIRMAQTLDRYTENELCPAALRRLAENLKLI